MVIPKSRKLEFRVMEVLWARGPSSMRDVVESMPEAGRPSYETVRSIIYRLQAKKVVRRVKRVSKTQIFEAVAQRSKVHETLINDFVELFGGELRLVIANLIQSGRFSVRDIQDLDVAAPTPPEAEQVQTAARDDLGPQPDAPARRSAGSLKWCLPLAYMHVAGAYFLPLIAASI